MTLTEVEQDDEPENDFSGTSEGSYGRDGHASRSFYRNEESYRSREGSFRSSQGSRSFTEGEGSFPSRRSEESISQSFRSGQDSYRSGEEDNSRRSFVEGEESYRSGDEERSYRSGEGSYRSGDSRSFVEGEGSFQSQEGYSSRGESYRSGEESYHSQNSRSYEQGEARFHSRDEREKSFASDGSRSQSDNSYYSGEGSRSFQDGEESYHSRQSGRSAGSQSYDSRLQGGSRSQEEASNSSEQPEDTSRHGAKEASVSASSSYSDREAPSFAEESPMKSPRKSMEASFSAIDNANFDAAPFETNRITDDEDEDPGFSGNGFSNKQFGGDEPGDADFGSFDAAGFDSTELANGFPSGDFDAPSMSAFNTDDFAGAFGAEATGDGGDDAFSNRDNTFTNNGFGTTDFIANSDGESLSQSQHQGLPTGEGTSSFTNNSENFAGAGRRGEDPPVFGDAFESTNLEASAHNDESSQELSSNRDENGSLDDSQPLSVDAEDRSNSLHHPGEPSADVDEDSIRNGQISDHESLSRGQGSFRSQEESYQSGESGSTGLDEGGTRSRNSSYRSGGSHSVNNNHNASYRSEEGSSSFGQGDDSFPSRNESYRTGESRSVESKGGSHRSQEDESDRSEGSRVYEQDGESYHSQDASYQSNQSFSVREEGDSYQSSNQNDQASFYTEATVSMAENTDTVESSKHSDHGEDSQAFSTENEGSPRSRHSYADDEEEDVPSFGEEESFSVAQIAQSPLQGNTQEHDDDHSTSSRSGSDSRGPPPEGQSKNQEESYQSSAPSDGKSFYSDDQSLGGSFSTQQPQDEQSSYTGSKDSRQVQGVEENEGSKSQMDEQNDESSIGIGDVFGQPNELFEHNQASGREDGENSQLERSEGREQDPSPGSRSSDEREESIGAHPEPSGAISVSDVHASRGATEKDQDSELKPNVTMKSKEKEDPEERRRRKRRKKKVQQEAKSHALLALVSNVNEAMLELEEIEAEQPDKEETSAHRLLHGFDALLGIYLQLSDELELLSTFAQTKKRKEREAMMPLQALKAVLSFAPTLDELFADLQPIILDCFEEDPDEEMDDMLYRLNSLVDLLSETTHRVGERQEWNERAETTYVTLLELMEREATELISYFEDVDTPEQILSANIHGAWSATGHIEELRELQYASDPWLFRQLCYEVMVSTDQWCPDTTILMEICGIDPALLEEEPDSDYLAEEEIGLIPQAAEHVLDKVNGEPLPRTITMASILRRILPPRAITDDTLLDNFTSIRNTMQSPLGLSATNIVSISSIPEQPNDPDSLGVGGMGKTTLAAMVAQHPDVRRYFIDGVVWVYVGDKHLNYNRYTQCLRELVAQLDFYQGVPLFAELLHVPGESLSKRRRREEGFMIYARDTIAEILHDRSVLIILDDVCFEPDLDWFDFAPMPGEENDELDSNCALLVTTRCRTLLPAADTVEVDMLDEADAISLLIQESGQLIQQSDQQARDLMTESREARSVVRECANHPLAVKSVGRWLHLKHATAGVVSSVDEIHSEVIKSMDKILKGGDHTGTDMMYEILSMSLSPAINGEPTSIIKFCLAAFIVVFCDREYISDFALTEPTPIIPMDMAELLFETLLEMNESSLLQKGSLFYTQKKEAAVLIPEALSALGVLKVITYSDAEEDEDDPDDEQKFLQVMHFIHHEYGEYLCSEEEALKDLTKDAERQWNRALVEAYLSQVEEWDMDLEDAGHSYALEMIISHMIRGGMYSAAADLLSDKSFVRGRLIALGRENCTRRHIKDCETLFMKLKERKQKSSKLEPRNVMKQAYQALGSQLTVDDVDMIDSRIKDVEVARAHYEIGFSLADKRCWDAAIAHWETSQEILVSALGTVEVVAGILFNIGVVYSEMNEYEQALDSLKQCLRIRGTIHGEEHILYAQTIQKIGDIFLGMSDYHEAMESYNWALDVMYIDPNIHRVEIGEILDNKGTIHYSKGEIEDALQCHQEALRSKQYELGEDHPELASTYHHIGNCLSDQGNVDDAIVHFEEAIRLKEVDPEGGPERDADVLTIEGILYNLEGNQEQGLECYEKSLQILVTKVPHRKEKVASLLHLIGCVYLMSGEQKKAMKLFEESLQARRKVLGFVHLDVASTLFNMAFLHQNRDRLDKALKCLEEALKIRQLRLPDSEKVAVTHEKIGTLARAIGKTKKAQINFEDALRIRRLIHGEQHEAVAAVHQELGDLMDDLGEYDAARDHYFDALNIRKDCLGLDDVAVAETLYSMGYTLHNNDQADRALVCFEESLNIRRYKLGEDSKEVGDTLNMMGFLKAKRGELDDALTLLWDALRIRKLQDDHIKVSETLKNIGNVHREKEERELAVECYVECLRIRRDELGTEHEKVADALIAMGNVQSDMGQKEEAMRSYQEALKIRTLAFGEHDESVAAVLQYMGTMEFRSGNIEKARDLLTEFIRIRRDNGTKNDGDYVNVLFMIGNIHKMHGQEEEAKLCWSEAYQVFQELGLAETNPQIAKLMNHLLKAEEEKEEAENRKKAKGVSVLSKMTEKLKGSTKEEKLPGKKRRKGKGIQL